MSELRALRDAYRQHKAQILQRLDQPTLAPRRVRALLQALSQHADAALCALSAQAQLPPGVALLAVGGYGRGELFPYSDVDVLILLDDASGPEHEATLRSVEQFVSSCWDAGLEIGSSVRTVAECLAESAKDVTVQTALLEHRRVCGNAVLVDRFAAAFAAAMNPQAFLVAKTLEMRQRHSRFEDTPYALEPNCKESPGGLRDFFLYRDLGVAAATNGKVIAHLVKANAPPEEGTGWHYHVCDFQIVVMTKGGGVTRETMPLKKD
jgi:[protein-PII] uridylyltransferase